MHNYLMHQYQNHIGIVGAGISGLALGCMLAKNNIPSILFEKHSKLGSHGAGISLSPNGLRVLEHMNLMNVIHNHSVQTSRTKIYSDSRCVYSADPLLRTMSRENLYKILLEEYLSSGGEILFNHDLKEIDNIKSKLFFNNGSEFIIRHIAACDGIKSLCREVVLKKNSDPIYSGYSAWRGLVASDQDHASIYLSKRSHIVTYPIDKNTLSFVGVVKTNKAYKQQWMSRGSIKEMREDLSMHPNEILNTLSKANEVHKWGIYQRPQLKNLFNNNITLLGDAAHPIVPFLGQGGCMALEDSFVFGKLLIANINDLQKAQSLYEKIRINRINKIKQMSEFQGRLYHLSNPLLVKVRNFLMNLSSSTTDKRLDRIWSYDPLDYL